MTTLYTITRDVVDDIQTAVLDLLEADERIEADELEGTSYSMYQHSCEVTTLTKQGVPIKITIEVGS